MGISFMDQNLVAKGLLWLNETVRHAMQGHLRQMYLSEEFWHYMKCLVGWITSRMKIAGRNINNLRWYDTTLMAYRQEELKSFLLSVKEESEKAGLKQHLTKFMASGPILCGE